MAWRRSSCRCGRVAWPTGTDSTGRCASPSRSPWRGAAVALAVTWWPQWTFAAMCVAAMLVGAGANVGLIAIQRTAGRTAADPTSAQARVQLARPGAGAVQRGRPGAGWCADRPGRLSRRLRRVAGAAFRRAGLGAPRAARAAGAPPGRRRAATRLGPVPHAGAAPSAGGELAALVELGRARLPGAGDRPRTRLLSLGDRPDPRCVRDLGRGDPAGDSADRAAPARRPGARWRDALGGRRVRALSVRAGGLADGCARRGTRPWRWARCSR
jgi:hypothetical protein